MPSCAPNRRLTRERQYNAGATNTLERGLAAAKRIGFPVMIKAAEGGGGKAPWGSLVTHHQFSLFFVFYILSFFM